MKEDGSLNLEQVGPIADHLVNEKVAGIYICGSTGEGPLLSTEERLATAEAFVKAAKGKLQSIVQVGHASLSEARKLAAHAKSIGADGISAIPSTYFNTASLDILIDCLCEIVEPAKELPFYYYHIPRLTSVEFDMLEFLHKGSAKLPNLVGIKFSSKNIDELQACLNFQDGRFTILFGVDEMLLSGLCAGATGAVGSTYNFAAPLYLRIIEAYQQGNLDKARKYQAQSVAMVKILHRYRGNPAYKAMMKLLGINCGPSRLPLVTLNEQELESMKQELDEIGFFDWIGKSQEKTL
jgi:N-acetylneuraminate lyase